MTGLRQWDVVKVRINPNDRDEHPAIILSPQEMLDNPGFKRINVLYGSTKRPGDTTRPGIVLIDEADGCEHATKVTCSFIHVVAKVKITSLLGHVSGPRMRRIRQEVVATLRFFG